MARFITITKVSIDNIKEVPEYKELIPENNSYEELKKSIQQLGFLDPITVNKNYEILDGYTRYRIAKELGIKEIPVEIYETSGREEELDIIASFNLKRRHLSKDEIIAIIDKITEKKKALKIQINEKYDKQKKEIKNEQNCTLERTINQKNNENISIHEEAKEITEELKRLDPDIQINKEAIRQYLQVKKEVPWLRDFIGDPKKDKIVIRTAYDIYLALKKKNLLDLDKRIPKSELKQLLTTKEGRKIILERDDLLDLILQHKMAVSQAINKIKTEEKLQMSKNRSRAKDEEDLDETDEEELSETEEGHREDSESDEDYPLLQEWQRVKEEEEEKEKQLTPQLNGQLLVKQEVAENKVQTDFLNELRTKGFAELPFEVALVKIEGKCYVINVGALHDLEQGVEKWKELVDFLSKHDIIIPGEAEGLYVIPWKLLGRCNEWK